MAFDVRSLVGAIAAAALVAGCASNMKVGNNFDYNSFAARVKTGESTGKDVAQWIGQPYGRGVELLPDGTRLNVWTYYYGAGQIPSGANTTFKMLQVKFDQDDRVQGYVWTGDLSGTTVEDKSQPK